MRLILLSNVQQMISKAKHARGQLPRYYKIPFATAQGCCDYNDLSNWLKTNHLHMLTTQYCKDSHIRETQVAQLPFYLTAQFWIKVADVMYQLVQ